MKTDQKSPIFWAPDCEICFVDKLSMKKVLLTNNFGLSSALRPFMAHSQEKLLENYFFTDLCSNLPGDEVEKCNFKTEKQVSFKFEFPFRHCNNTPKS